jgi:hypothetical protein
LWTSLEANLQQQERKKMLTIFISIAIGKEKKERGQLCGITDHEIVEETGPFAS